jgi:hypothetical protein
MSILSGSPGVTVAVPVHISSVAAPGVCGVKAASGDVSELAPYSGRFPRCNGYASLMMPEGGQFIMAGGLRYASVPAL